MGSRKEVCTPEDQWGSNPRLPRGAPQAEVPVAWWSSPTGNFVASGCEVFFLKIFALRRVFLARRDAGKHGRHGGSTTWASVQNDWGWS